MISIRIHLYLYIVYAVREDNDYNMSKQLLNINNKYVIKDFHVKKRS